jgi:isopropylmalate/homocitrate/citramalate synthase
VHKYSYAVSPYNKEAEEELGRRFPKGIVIYDTTLRDGEQMVGVRFTRIQKLEIARRLAKIGVHQIELGFPAVSDEEQSTIKAIVKEGLGPKMLVLSRLVKEDIDAAVDTGADMVMLFIATSGIHLKHKLGKTREQVKEMLAEATDHAKARGIEFSFTTEDATRSDWGFMDDLFKMAETAGASRVGIADTTGSATPEAVAFIIKKLKRISKLPLSVHLHNDFGLALASALASIREGATHINASVSGLGERAGNVPLEQLVASLQVLYGIELGVDMEGLTDLSRMVAGYAKVQLSPHTPLVGRNAFAHESGIHVAAVLNEPSTYEPIPPECVGNRRRICFGKHSGRTAIRKKLEEKGRGGDETLVEKVLKRVKAMGETNGGVSEDEFWDIVDELS